MFIRHNRSVESQWGTASLKNSSSGRDEHNDQLLYKKGLHASSCGMQLDQASQSKRLEAPTTISFFAESKPRTQLKSFVCSTILNFIHLHSDR